jgi:hypothetical protein
MTKITRDMIAASLNSIATRLATIDDFDDYAYAASALASLAHARATDDFASLIDPDAIEFLNDALDDDDPLRDALLLNSIDRFATCIDDEFNSLMIDLRSLYPSTLLD